MTAPAWRILALTGVAGLAVALGVLACLAAVAYHLEHGQLVHGNTVLLPVLAVALLWGFQSVLRAALPPVSGVPVDQQQAPGLLDLVGATAAHVGVAPPPRVLLGTACAAQLTHQGGESVLVVGAPLVWGLPAQELRQVLLPVLASRPEHERRSVRCATAVALRLDHAPLRRSLTGPLLRRLRTVCRRAMLDLRQRSDAAVAVRIGSRPTLDPRILVDLEEAWEHLLRGFTVPAWSRGRRPTQVLAALADLRCGTETVWRTDGSGSSQLDVALLEDPDGLDARLSELLAVVEWGGRPGQPLEWPRYLQDVVGPALRESAARLVAAVDITLGRPGPACPSRVLDALDEGAAGAVVGLLRAQRDAGGAQPDREDLAASLQALVACAAETSRTARLVMSWRTGPVLVDHDGRVLPDLHDSCLRAAHGQTTALRAALTDLGIPAEDPVWLAGDEPADVGPEPVAALADIWHRGRLYDLVVCRDQLVLLLTAGPGLDLRGAIEHCAGDDLRTTDRLQRRLDDDLGAALATSEHNVEVRLADVVDGRIRAVLGQRMWRTVLRTVDGRRIVLRNGRSPRTVFAVRALLSAALGDRLHVRGVDPRFPRLARIAPTSSLVCAAAALVLAVGAGYVATAGRVVPAVLVAEVAEVAEVSAGTCTVRFSDPWDSAPVTTQVDCPRQPVAAMDVLALPAPLRGQAMALEDAGTGLVLALSLLLGPAAVGVVVRTRGSRRRERDRGEG